MENSMSRILIETTVRQTLKGLKENPKRSIRNLVDMSLHFSEGRFQSHFFQTARTMLEHEDSAYYSLAEHSTSHIETEHLVKFGMNLGYNSCTWGAQRIRRNEQRLGFNIPWTVLFQMDDLQCLDHLFEYDSAITEGEQLGRQSLPWRCCRWHRGQRGSRPGRPEWSAPCLPRSAPPPGC